MMESIQQELREDFLGSSLDAYVDLTYLWGIDGVDRTGFDMFGTNSYRGSPVYSSFDLFQESSQRSVLEACDEMITCCPWAMWGANSSMTSLCPQAGSASSKI